MPSPSAEINKKFKKTDSTRGNTANVAEADEEGSLADGEMPRARVRTVQTEVQEFSSGKLAGVKIISFLMSRNHIQKHNIA